MQILTHRSDIICTDMLVVGSRCYALTRGRAEAAARALDDVAVHGAAMGLTVAERERIGDLADELRRRGRELRQ